MLKVALLAVAAGAIAFGLARAAAPEAKPASTPTVKRTLLAPTTLRLGAAAFPARVVPQRVATPRPTAAPAAPVVSQPFATAPPAPTPATAVKIVEDHSG